MKHGLKQHNPSATVSASPNQASGSLSKGPAAVVQTNYLRVYGPTYPNTKTEFGKKTDLRQMTCMPKQNSFRFFYFHTYTYCTLTTPPFSPTFAYPFKKKNLS